MTLTLASRAQSQRGPAVGGTLETEIAAATKLEEKDVAAVLKALGPAISGRLARGEKIEMPGLGVFRVVRIPEHKDLVDGRPATIPSVNYVEFMAGTGIVSASNAPGAVPAAVVPPFQYNPLPNQVKGQKDEGTRVPNTRIR
jgi:nucleoid DNA-binding protein